MACLAHPTNDNHPAELPAELDRDKHRIILTHFYGVTTTTLDTWSEPFDHGDRGLMEVHP